MAISGINSGVPSSVYQTNMQQVGGQASVANKRDLAPTETESTTTAPAFDEVMLTGDGVDSASDAFDNAAHVGLLGAAADDDDPEVGDDTEVPSEVGLPVGGDDIDDEVGVPGEDPVVGDPDAPEDPDGPAGPGGPAGPEDPAGSAGPDDPEGPGGPGESDDAAPAERSKEDMMADMKKAQEEREAWEKFMVEQLAQHQKHMAELMKILQDLQDFMFTTLQEMAKNQADAGHRCAMMWDDCIRGPR